MADAKKKPAVGATVAPPDEKADFLTQLQNTFERGVVSAEVDIGGLLPRGQQQGGGSVKTLFGEAARISTGPAGAHEQLLKSMKSIANMYGGQFTTHAPMQANPADLMQVGQAKAAQLLKKSLDYTNKLGGKVITVHPIGQMEYYFIDPFVGTKMQVPNPFMLAKSEEELGEMMTKFKVNDPLLKQEITKEWENWVRVLPTHFAEKFAPMAARKLEEFAGHVAGWRMGELLKKHGNDFEEIRQEIEGLNGKLADVVQNSLWRQFNQAKLSEDARDHLIATAAAERAKAKGSWSKVAMASLDTIKEDGTVPRPSKRLMELSNMRRDGKTLSKDEHREFQEEYENWRSEDVKVRSKAWADVIEDQRYGPFDESIDRMKAAVRNTFRQLFHGIKEEGGDLYASLQNRKIKIGLENLFPPVPEKGYMQGFAHFYKPEHMAEMVKLIQAEAKEQGLPEDIVGFTFDVGHAASSGIKPSEFLDKLKKSGVKVEHVHLVGGPGYGHDHIAWGDWLDQVSRMDPDIVQKLVDVGAINIEGGLGHYDTEVTLNALWDQGLPLEAMMAMAGAPDAFTPELLQYTGFQPSAYLQGVARGYVGSALPQRAFYSFQQETVPMPMRSAFGAYTAPALTGGGYSIGPGRTSAIWPSAQPMLYSSKNGGGE